MNLKTSFSFVFLIFLNLVQDARASGVLTIRLTGFRNPYGRTYDGTCCDPSPRDRNPTCVDQCDYVMRLIVMGLGRANDHVFLFHRPLKYDSNNIEFEHGDSNLLLTVLFDSWPQDGQVKMNAFFYDYDDFDHTTTLVDWFETDLKHTGNQTTDNTDVWGHFQEQSVIGNRQSDKTLLTFEWSALHSENVYNPAFHVDNAHNNSKLGANINLRSSNLKKSIIQKQGFPIGVGSPFRKNDEQQFYEEFAKRKPIDTLAFAKSVERFDKGENTTKEGLRNKNSNFEKLDGQWDKNMILKGAVNLKPKDVGDSQKDNARYFKYNAAPDISKAERLANDKVDRIKDVHENFEMKDHELNLKLNKTISAFKRLSRNKGMKKQIRRDNVPFKTQFLNVENNDVAKKEGSESIKDNENLTKSNDNIVPELQDSTTSGYKLVRSENININNTEISETPDGRIIVNHLTTITEARDATKKPIEIKQITIVYNQSTEETADLISDQPTAFKMHDKLQESHHSTPSYVSNEITNVGNEMPTLSNNSQTRHSENMDPSDETGLGNFKRAIPQIEPYINTVYKTVLDPNYKAFPFEDSNIEESVKQIFRTSKEEQTNYVISTNGDTILNTQDEISTESNKDKSDAGLRIVKVTPAFENNIITELSERNHNGFNGLQDNPISEFSSEEMTSNLNKVSSATTSTNAQDKHTLMLPQKDGRQANSGFSTARNDDHTREKTGIGYFTTKSYQSGQDVKVVKIYTDSNETKNIGTAQTRVIDLAEHKRETEESINDNNMIFPNFSSHYRKDVEVNNNGEETVPLVVDLTSTTPQIKYFTKSEYLTEIARTWNKQKPEEINELMVGVKSLSGKRAHEEQGGRVTSFSPFTRSETITTESVESTTERQQPKVWFNARKSQQSNGELLQNNIKVLKTFKFETVAPFQWFVTAQRTYVRPVMQQSKLDVTDFNLDTLQPTELANPVVANVNNLMEVDHLQTGVTTNRFIPSSDNFALDSSTRLPIVPESFSNDSSNTRTQDEITSHQSVKETELEIKNIVEISTVRERNPSYQENLNNGLNTAENKHEKTTKSYSTFNIPLFFLPFEKIENVENSNDDKAISSPVNLPNLDTVSAITKSSMISEMAKSLMSSTASASTMTERTIRSHISTHNDDKNKSMSQQRSLEKIKSSNNGTFFSDNINFINIFDKSYSIPKNPDLVESVKSKNNIDYSEDGNIESRRSQYFKEANSLEQISVSEPAKEQEPYNGVFMKEINRPGAMLNDAVNADVVNHDSTKPFNNTVNNYNLQRKKYNKINDLSPEGQTIYKEQIDGQGGEDEMHFIEEVQTSIIKNVKEQRENFQTEGSGLTQEISNLKEEEKLDFKTEGNHRENSQEINSKQGIKTTIQQEIKSKEVAKNSVDNISFKSDDVNGNNPQGNNHLFQKESKAENRQQIVSLESRPDNGNSVDSMSVENITLENVNTAKKTYTVNMRQIIPRNVHGKKSYDAVNNTENLYEKNNTNVKSDTVHGGRDGSKESMVTKDNNIEELNDNNNDVSTATKIFAEDISKSNDINPNPIASYTNVNNDRNARENINTKNVDILDQDSNTVVHKIKTTTPAPLRSDFLVRQAEKEARKQEVSHYLANKNLNLTMLSGSRVLEQSKLKSMENDHVAVDDVFENSRRDGILETLNEQAQSSLAEDRDSKSWPGLNKEQEPSLDIESYSLKKETLEALSRSASKRQFSTTVTKDNALPISARIDQDEIMDSTRKEDIVRKFNVAQLEPVEEYIQRPLIAGENADSPNQYQTAPNSKPVVNFKNFESSAKSSPKLEPSDMTYYSNFDTTFDHDEVFAYTTQEATEVHYVESSSKVTHPRESTQTSATSSWPQETKLSTGPPNLSATGKLNIKSEKLLETKDDMNSIDFIKPHQTMGRVTPNVFHVTTPSLSTNTMRDVTYTRSNKDYPKDTYNTDEYLVDPNVNEWDLDAKTSTEMKIQFQINDIENHLGRIVPVTFTPSNHDNIFPDDHSKSEEASTLGNFDEKSPSNDVLLQESLDQTSHDPFNLMNLFIANINLLDSIRDKKNRDAEDFNANVTKTNQDHAEERLKAGDESVPSNEESMSNKDDNAREHRGAEVTRASNEHRLIEVTRAPNDYDVTDATTETTNTDNSANDFSSDEKTSGVQNVTFNSGNTKLAELTDTGVATITQREKLDVDNSHKQFTHQTMTSSSDIDVTQSTTSSLSLGDEQETTVSEEIPSAAFITTEATVSTDSILLSSNTTVSNIPTEIAKDETKTATTTRKPKAYGNEPLTVTNLLDNTKNYAVSSGSVSQTTKNILSMDSYPQSKTLTSDKHKEQDPKYLPSIMNPVLFVPPTKADLDNQPLLDLYLQSYSHPKQKLNTEMKTLPENGFKLHTVTQDSLNRRPTNQPLHELPWLKLSRVNSGVKRNNVHRKINLDKLRNYIKDIRHGPSVHVPRQGLYTPKMDVANQTLRAPDAAAVLPNAVERYGSPYTSINGVSTVFTRYWPAVLGVSIGTMFLLTALITSILCRQRRMLVQRASWSDSPQYLSEPPDPSEYATSSAASLSSDLTRSSVNLVGRHS